MSFIPSSLSLTDITSDFSKSIIKSRTRRLTLYDQTRPITNTEASVEQVLLRQTGQTMYHPSFNK